MGARGRNSADHGWVVRAIVAKADAATSLEVEGDPLELNPLWLRTVAWKSWTRWPSGGGAQGRQADDGERGGHRGDS
jgi:hypothetical protein